MKTLSYFLISICVLLLGCAGERQGLVCEEMEYRLNTMAYSPDQRAYAEEELRVCREEEARKKADGVASRQSIYDRFASTESAKSENPADSSGAVANRSDEAQPREVSVSEALKDSSGQKTVSIYDRYGSKAGSGSSLAADGAEVSADTSASDVSNFQ